MVLPFFLWYTKQNGKLGILPIYQKNAKKTAKQEVVYEQTNRSSGGSSQMSANPPCLTDLQASVSPSCRIPPGVTRDRIYADVEWLDRKFTLIDTGGMEIGSEEVIQKQIVQQAQIAIETADVILFVTDVKTGVTEDDVKVANLLRRTKKACCSGGE